MSDLLGTVGIALAGAVLLVLSGVVVLKVGATLWRHKLLVLALVLLLAVGFWGEKLPLPDFMLAGLPGGGR